MPKRNISNGAREALIKVMGGRVQLAEAILVTLWLEGYKIAPLEPEDL